LYNTAKALYGQLLGDGIIIQTDYPISNTNVLEILNLVLMFVQFTRVAGMLETPDRHIQVL
jgi:hypothetical protein